MSDGFFPSGISDQYYACDDEFGSSDRFEEEFEQDDELQAERLMI